MNFYVYYGGTANHHDWWVRGMNKNIDHPEAKDFTVATYSMGLARMKRDRFVSLSAGKEREGVVVTRPFFHPRRDPAHQCPLPARRLYPGASRGWGEWGGHGIRPQGMRFF